MLAEIASIIAPLFICAGIGFLWGRFDRPFDARMITELSINFGMPCLIFSTLTRLEVSPQAFGEMAGVYTVALVASYAIAAVLVRVFGLEMRTFVPPIASSNTGNMGLPVVLFAFGEAGLALAISIFVIASITGLTIGAGLYSRRRSLNVVFGNPLVYVILIALVFMAGEITPPVWLANTVALIGGMAIPLMIISLGVALAKLKVQSAGRSLALSAVKLAFGFAIGLGAAEAFGLEGIARGVLIVQLSMPVAVHNYLFAQRFDRHPEEIAGLVLISTAMSYATLPVLLWFVL